MANDDVHVMLDSVSSMDFAVKDIICECFPSYTNGDAQLGPN